MFVEILQNYVESLFDKLAGWKRPATLLTKTPAQVLCPELCEILKNTFFTLANDFFGVFFKISPYTKNNKKQMWNGVS